MTEEPCDICPWLKWIQSWLNIQMSWNHTHLHTRNCPNTHAHAAHARLSSSLTSETLCPLLLWLSLCLSLTPSLHIIHTHCHFDTCTHTHASIRSRCVSFSTAAHCLSSNESSVESTKSSARSNLQGRCAELSHAAVKMTTVKCLHFLERLYAILLTQQYPLDQLYPYLISFCCHFGQFCYLIQVQYICLVPCVHLQSAKGTCCRWERRAVSHIAKQSCSVFLFHSRLHHRVLVWWRTCPLEMCGHRLCSRVLVPVTCAVRCMRAYW